MVGHYGYQGHSGSWQRCGDTVVPEHCGTEETVVLAHSGYQADAMSARTLQVLGNVAAGMDMMRRLREDAEKPASQSNSNSRERCEISSLEVGPSVLGLY